MTKFTSEQQKGKSWEEKFGKEKADLMKKNLAEMTRQKFLGVPKTESQKQKLSKFQSQSYEQKWGKEVADRIKEKRSKKIIKRMKGKTREEIYGIEKAKQITENHKLKLKGITYEQRYGAEEAKRKKEIQYQKRKKWTNEKIINAYKQIVEQNGPILKSDINNFARKKQICFQQAIEHQMESLDKLVQVTGIDFKKPEFTGRKGKNEEMILNTLENQIGINILRNHYIAGKWVDGFIPQINTVIEVDEPYHNNRKIQDTIRENYIKQKINCNIIRIDEQKFLNNINNHKIIDFSR